MLKWFAVICVIRMSVVESRWYCKYLWSLLRHKFATNITRSADSWFEDLAAGFEALATGLNVIVVP